MAIEEHMPQQSDQGLRVPPKHPRPREIEEAEISVMQPRLVGVGPREPPAPPMEIEETGISGMQPRLVDVGPREPPAPPMEIEEPDTPVI